MSCPHSWLSFYAYVSGGVNAQAYLNDVRFCKKWYHSLQNPEWKMLLQQRGVFNSFYNASWRRSLAVYIAWPAGPAVKLSKVTN